MIATGLLIGAMLIQVLLVNRLPLPLEGAPDLTLLVVVGYGLVRGPVRGTVAGFCAGLVVDVLPPASHAIGQYALAYCVAGFLAGRCAERRGAGGQVIAAVLGSVIAPVLAAASGALLGDPRITPVDMAVVLPLTAGYNLLASPVVLWGVKRLLGGEPDRAAGRQGRPVRSLT
ncbi:rod shape-determining protein MreD [Thermostaphylospora chromogena]|uniref:Rod shape-determining protein MreD n=1 Tax=Thermostaphylospora chromogena TaxID=35622 RepID=A0A1H1I589_9ACTN|nr:rod shape-determining protein MreD [Thermostaphylospora chromogena]SDR32877.1 rod shape-determining protein MreD [Thermostaphylospora chromogena]